MGRPLWRSYYVTQRGRQSVGDVSIVLRPGRRHDEMASYVLFMSETATADDDNDPTRHQQGKHSCRPTNWPPSRPNLCFLEGDVNHGGKLSFAEFM